MINVLYLYGANILQIRPAPTHTHIYTSCSRTLQQCSYRSLDWTNNPLWLLEQQSVTFLCFSKYSYLVSLIVSLTSSCICQYDTADDHTTVLIQEPTSCQSEKTELNQILWLYHREQQLVCSFCPWRPSNSEIWSQLFPLPLPLWLWDSAPGFWTLTLGKHIQCSFSLETSSLSDCSVR